MATIPQELQLPEIPFMKKIHEGKVRATYSADNESMQGRLFQLSSDRVSIFNFVLNGIIPQKGEILNALTVFWLMQVLKNFSSHLIAYGPSVFSYLPPQLKHNDEVSPALKHKMNRSGLVVKKLDLLPIEAIVRGYLTGSGWSKYKQTGQCYGYSLPNGLWDGAKLPYAMFTPTEKSDDDPWIHHDEVIKRHGGIPERVSLQIYQQASAYAESRGIIIADTKCEMDGAGVIGDEILTTDSSRFWDKAEWEKCVAEKKSPTSLDKEFVRKWGKTHGIDKLDPTNPDHIKQVLDLGVPNEVAQQTQLIYRYLFWRMTGQKLELFQQSFMSIEDARTPEVKIAVVIGSESDLPQMTAGLHDLRQAQNGGCCVSTSVNVISCHRNPLELQNFTERESPDVVIAGAGMAAALPGIIKAWFRHFSKAIPVIGVAFEGKNEAATRAAQLSIEQLPGQPVILNANGKAFSGPQGFQGAVNLALNAEFMPEKISAPKPAQYNLTF